MRLFSTVFVDSDRSRRDLNTYLSARCGGENAVDNTRCWWSCRRCLSTTAIYNAKYQQPTGAMLFTGNRWRSRRMTHARSTDRSSEAAVTAAILALDDWWPLFDYVTMTSSLTVKPASGVLPEMVHFGGSEKETKRCGGMGRIFFVKWTGAKSQTDS